MEKLKALFDAVIAYCVKEPFHAVVVIGLIAYLLLVATWLFVIYAKKPTVDSKSDEPTPTRNTKKKTQPIPKNVTKTSHLDDADNFSVTVKTDDGKKRRKYDVGVDEKEEETHLPPPEIITSVRSIKKTDGKKTTAKNASVKSSKEKPSTSKTVNAPSPAPTKVEKTTPVKTEQREREKEREEETFELFPKTPLAEYEAPFIKEKLGIKYTKALLEEIKLQKEKIYINLEDSMLLDELKDINTELDFYEEDESDKMARFSGKWVICRVVTNDSKNEDMYFFELHASNDEKLLSSEEYTTYNGALRGIETHKANILRDNFRVSLTKKNEYVYKLLNGKGMLLCTSNAFEKRADCARVIELTKRFARTAFIDENIQDLVVKVPEEVDLALPPIPATLNGKWIIDRHLSVDGEKVFIFALISENDECLLYSEEYASYIGAVNGIQTHKTNIKNGNFSIILTKQGDYVFKLLNGNGQLLYMGDHYKTRALCEYAVELIKKYSATAPVLTDPELMNE